MGVEQVRAPASSTQADKREGKCGFPLTPKAVLFPWGPHLPSVIEHHH